MRPTRFEPVRKHRGRGVLAVDRTLALVPYHVVAKRMGISVARVGQLEESGLARLRQCFALIDQGVAVDRAIAACKGTNGRPRKVAP